MDPRYIRVGGSSKEGDISFKIRPSFNNLGTMTNSKWKRQELDWVEGLDLKQKIGQE